MTSSGRAGSPVRPLLCVIDVDGTLLTGRHELSPRTRAAVHDARDHGISVMLGSSRGVPALLPVLDALGAGDDDVFVAAQGAVTARRVGVGGEVAVLRGRPAALGAAHVLVRVALERGVAVSWYSGNDWLVSHADEHVRREAEVVGVSPTVRDLLDLGTGPDKLMLIAEPAALADITGLLPAALQAQPSNPGYLEVTAKGVDKGTAVAAYCEASGIPPERVVAIGNGPNDLSLFAFAGHGIAPANADPEVLARADEVTASNDEDGVAQALRGLIALTA